MLCWTLSNLSLYPDSAAAFRKLWAQARHQKTRVNIRDSLARRNLQGEKRLAKTGVTSVINRTVINMSWAITYFHSFLTTRYRTKFYFLRILKSPLELFFMDGSNGSRTVDHMDSKNLSVISFFFFRAHKPPTLFPLQCITAKISSFTSDWGYESSSSCALWGDQLGRDWIFEEPKLIWAGHLERQQSAPKGESHNAAVILEPGEGKRTDFDQNGRDTDDWILQAAGRYLDQGCGG